MEYLICALIGYFIGSSNMALYLSKIKKVDLRAAGSGNLGTSNATMLLGKKAGILTFLHDFLKIILAAWICSKIFPDLQYAIVIASASGVLGHMYPFYLKFKGGKGFASYIGMTFAIDLKFGLVMLGTMLIIVLITDWIVSGTFFYILMTPVCLFYTYGIIPALITSVASICIFYKHLENIKRKRQGEEPGVRSVLLKSKK